MITNRFPLKSIYSKIFVSIILQFILLTPNFAMALTYMHEPSQELKYWAEDGTVVTLQDVKNARWNAYSLAGPVKKSTEEIQRMQDSYMALYKKLDPVRRNMLAQDLSVLEVLIPGIRKERQNLIGVGPLYQLILGYNYTALNDGLNLELEELVGAAYDNPNVVVTDVYGRNANAEEIMYGHYSGSIASMFVWEKFIDRTKKDRIPNTRQILTVAIYSYVFIKNELGELDGVNAGIQEICKIIDLQDNKSNDFGTLCSEIQNSPDLGKYIAWLASDQNTRLK